MATLSQELVNQIVLKAFEGKTTAIKKEDLVVALSKVEDTSGVDKLVSALQELKSQDPVQLSRKLSFQEIDIIQKRIFQCFNSYGMDVGKDYYVDTETITRKVVSSNTSASALAAMQVVHWSDLKIQAKATTITSSTPSKL